MFRKMIYVISFVLVLGLVGSASAGVLYSDSFNRPDSPTLGTNDNALGGIISAPWVEVEDDETQNHISGNALVAEGGACNSYIDHKFTGAELPISFTVEFDVMPTPESNNWFALEFARGPESFTTGLDVNQNRMTFGFLMRPQRSFIIWDGTTRVGLNNSDIIDNSSNPARVRLKIDSPDGYSDGNTATVRVWINDMLVEDLFGNGDSYDFVWDGHTDGLYISFENYQTPNKSIDNLVISSPFSMKEAIKPSPENEATDVLREVVLSWQPGEFADQHDVYFGASLDDVNNATTTVDPAGVYMGRQSQSTYVPGRLDLGQTYYWRVDEVNAAPDYTVFKGDVWLFTAEPIGYPIENIDVTASSENRPDEGPGNTINSSGLDGDDLHSSENTAMWLSNIVDPNAAWIQYEFDRVRKLYQMWVWNYNSSVEPVVGFGIKEATIEYSVDGTNWSILGTTHEFVRAPGLDNYAHNTTVDFSGVAAKYVRLTANSNWGGILNQYGLSEVRFFYIPIYAREPSPAFGAIDVPLDLDLTWRASREATAHEVYISDDLQAVVDGTASVTTVTETNHGPLALDLGKTYYWRVDEVNDAETPTTWQGDLWNFRTHEYFVVDDFEDYNDYPPDEIFSTWLDGYGIVTNGSTAGYPEPDFLAGEHYVETSIVHGGAQSMPLFYDNNFKYSEATMTLVSGRDWTRRGAGVLSLWFYGNASNAAELMYVALNGSATVYHDNPNAAQIEAWTEWTIDLQEFATQGVNLANVNTIAIGFGDKNNLQAGGSGMVFFDDIRLYRLAPEPAP